MSGMGGRLTNRGSARIARAEIGIRRKKMLEEGWNTRCLNSIRKEKAEAEKYYGIKINATDIQCSFCNKSWNFFHICAGTSQERREEIERIREAWDRPVSLMGVDGWRIELGIEKGMSKEEAFEKFREWQLNKKTCQRCEGDKYFEYCPIRLVCKEADNVRDAERDDDRGRTFEINGAEPLRTVLSETRKRASLR